MQSRGLQDVPERKVDRILHNEISVSATESAAQGCTGGLITRFHNCFLLPTSWRREVHMRIAQVAPLYESVPPKLYGGTERIVSLLTEDLVRLGHDVTLFASGDSMTTARLVAGCPQSLRMNPSCIDQLAHHVNMLEQVFDQRDDFDFIHFHVDYLHFPLSRREQVAQVTTLHGRLDLPDLQPLYRTFSDMPIVSISDAQRRPLPWANWQATVHHGLPEDSLAFYGEPGKYLAFLGRTSPEKGLDRAIQIAKRVGMP